MHALYDLVKDLHPQPQILTPAQRRACPRLWYCCARFRVCWGGWEGGGSMCVSLSLCVHVYMRIHTCVEPPVPLCLRLPAAVPAMCVTPLLFSDCPCALLYLGLDLRVSGCMFFPNFSMHMHVMHAWGRTDMHTPASIHTQAQTPASRQVPTVAAFLTPASQSEHVPDTFIDVQCVLMRDIEYARWSIAESGFQFARALSLSSTHWLTGKGI